MFFASFVLKAIHFRTTGTSHSVLGNCLDLLLAKMKRAHVVPEGALADAGGAAIRAAHSDSWVQFPACVSGVEVSIVQEKPRFRVTYRSRCEHCNRRQDLVTWSNNLCSYKGGGVTVRHAHGDVHYKKQGRGAGGARLRHAFPRWGAKKKKKRKDVFPLCDVRVIESFIRSRCVTSPCLRDTIRRQRGPKQWETARKMYKYETWEELWAAFKELYIALALRLAVPGKKDECPMALRRFAPRKLCPGKEATCLCAKCEGCHQLTRTRLEVWGLLKDLLDGGDDGEEEGAGGREGRVGRGAYY